MPSPPGSYQEGPLRLAAWADRVEERLLSVINVQREEPYSSLQSVPAAIWEQYGYSWGALPTVTNFRGIRGLFAVIDKKLGWWKAPCWYAEGVGADFPSTQKDRDDVAKCRKLVSAVSPVFGRALDDLLTLSATILTTTPPPY